MSCGKRVSELMKQMGRNGLDAFIVNKPANIFYLTSFISDSVVLVISPRKNFIITDFRYAEAVDRNVKGFKLIVIGGKINNFSGAIAAALGNGSNKNVGFESFALTFAQYKNIKFALGNNTLIPCANAIESIRAVKDAGEISAIKKAFSITKKTFDEIKRIINPAITELEIVRRIKESFIRMGAEAVAFEPIVATQPDASEPHYRSKIKKLGKNRPILIDIGARYGSYNSDLTRILALGRIKPKFTEMYDVLLEAQNRAIDMIRPGAKISDVDGVARQYIAKRGFGRFFGHSLGHGIGLEVHEEPIISGKNTESLKDGMVFTVEPGIYVPKFGGLRLEDTVLVTKKGCKVLTDDIDK